MTTVLRAGLRPMRPRDPREPHRAASPLELFFDLTFVVGVSVAANELLQAEEAGSLGSIVAYLLVFGTIWWGWVNFTWFASAFDTDDWLYRILTVLQMAGVLVVAAGIPGVAERGDLRITVIGYVILRLALVAQWLRASRDPRFHRTALRYAAGVSGVQVGWILLLLVPAALLPVGIVLLLATEMLVPPWAERSGITPFHRHHIAERYGLFTLIVLGEGLLSVTNALIDAQQSARAGQLVALGVTALVMIAGMWWVYYSRSAPVLGADVKGTFAFGYLHYFVFASAAALASGIELAIHHVGEPGEESERELVGALAPGVHLATTLPLAVYLLAVWWTVLRPSLGRVASAAVPVLAVAIGACALLPYALQVAAALVVVVVVVLEVDGDRRHAVEVVPG